MNGYVSDAILSDVGAGTFKVERQGPTTSEEEEERQRNNPRITLVELDTLPRPATTIDAVMAQAYNGAPGRLSRRAARQRRRSAASRRNTSSSPATTPSSAALPSRFEVERARPVALPRLRHRRSAVQGRQPDRPKVIQINGVHFRVVGVNEEKGSLFGNSQDEFIVIPLGAFQKLFGSRRSLELTVKPRDPMQHRADDGRGARGAAHRSASSGRRSPTTSACTRPTRS